MSFWWILLEIHVRIVPTCGHTVLLYPHQHHQEVMILPPDFIFSGVVRIAEQRSRTNGCQNGLWGPRPHWWTTRTELVPEIKGVVSRCDILPPPQFSSGWGRGLQAGRCNCRLLGFRPRVGPRCPWCRQVREFLRNHVCRPLLPLLSSATHHPLQPLEAPPNGHMLHSRGNTSSSVASVVCVLPGSLSFRLGSVHV